MRAKVISSAVPPLSVSRNISRLLSEIGDNTEVGRMIVVWFGSPLLSEFRLTAEPPAPSADQARLPIANW